MASGSATIKHNLMFTLDDSGSMQQDYTPDYINDSMCFDSKDDNGSISNSLKPCMPGDPLFMSPDFNTQYYNPDILVMIHQKKRITHLILMRYLPRLTLIHSTFRKRACYRRALPAQLT